MVLVFDLDDTLYDEISFVKSGLKEVSFFLEKKYNISQSDSYELMIKELDANGRGKVFDILLKAYNLYSKANVRTCLSIYRLHTPNIKLNQDSIDCFERFKNYPKYIVTDGNKIVQKNKVEALLLEEKVKKVFITHNYGVKHSKPSPFCFMRIAQLENTSPKNIVYIGDNPNKDFIGIKPIGFKTIRINQGMFKDQTCNKLQEAHMVIDNLNQLTLSLLKTLTST